MSNVQRFSNEVQKAGKDGFDAAVSSFGEAKEGQEENTVAGVIQKGYSMNDKVIRYSIVHVVK